MGVLFTGGATCTACHIDVITPRYPSPDATNEHLLNAGWTLGPYPLCPDCGSHPDTAAIAADARMTLHALIEDDQHNGRAPHPRNHHDALRLAKAAHKTNDHDSEGDAA